MKIDGLEAKVRELVGSWEAKPILLELSKASQRIADDNEDMNAQGEITAETLRRIAHERW